MITWTEELHSMKPDTNSNNYNESQNRPPLSICNSFLSLELSVKFLESTQPHGSWPAQPIQARLNQAAGAADASRARLRESCLNLGFSHAFFTFAPFRQLS